uniref:Lipocalin/cytosolic fatty-acid binding domain-containing protein n=1 Tax=Rhinopithecus roxellana TaxID=61622 RepID=A0A2K6RNB9_RHIRO
MQCLLLTLGVALICGVQAIDSPQAMQDVELPKLAGTWHSMAMAASDFSLLETKEAPLRIYISSLQPTPEGNLEIALRRWSQKRSPFRDGNQCVEEKIVAEKTENPIEFKINCKCRPQPRQLWGHWPARTLEADDKVMAEFINFLKTLPVHMQIFLDMTQAEGELPPGQPQPWLEEKPPLSQPL